LSSDPESSDKAEPSATSATAGTRAYWYDIASSGASTPIHYEGFTAAKNLNPPSIFHAIYVECREPSSGEPSVLFPSYQQAGLPRESRSLALSRQPLSLHLDSILSLYLPTCPSSHWSGPSVQDALSPKRVRNIQGKWKSEMEGG